MSEGLKLLKLKGGISMNYKNKCFVVESEILYLEKVLVEFNSVPIFFLCKTTKEDYYISLCIDTKEFSYVVTKLSIADVSDLLHGKISMRNVITKQDFFWRIETGDELSDDIVSKHIVTELDENYLPDKDACFEVLTDDMSNYVEEFDKMYENQNRFVDLPIKEVSLWCSEMSECYMEIFEKSSIYGNLGVHINDFSDLNFDKICNQRECEMTDKEHFEWKLNEYTPVFM